MIHSDEAGRRRGFWLTLSGVLILTPDTLLIRLIDIDPWTMNFWRGSMMAFSLFIGYFLVRGKSTVNDIMKLGFAGLGIAGLYALNAITFVFAVNLTLVANVLIILSTTPLIAALLSIFILKEDISKATWTAIIFGIMGVAILVGNSIQAANVIGDIFSLITAFSLAVTFIIIRKYKKLNMIPATALGAALSAVISFPLADPMSIELNNWGLLFLLGLIVMPLSFALITFGLRLLPAPEVALLMLIETVLGPLWVGIVINEIPDSRTLIGGGIIILAVLLQALWRIKR